MRAARYALVSLLARAACAHRIVYDDDDDRLYWRSDGALWAFFIFLVIAACLVWWCACDNWRYVPAAQERWCSSLNPSLQQERREPGSVRV